METSLFPGGASVASHGHLHGLPAPYLLAAAAAHHHSLTTSPPPPHLPHLPGAHPPPHLFPPVSYHSAAAAASAAALSRLTQQTNEQVMTQSVSKSSRLVSQYSQQ